MRQEFSWRKSSHNGANSSCVEAADFVAATGVRDSTNIAGRAR